MKTLLPYLFVCVSFFVSAQSETLTYIPDDNFEQALIDLGYDDVLDDYVLTANIDKITELKLSRHYNDPIGIKDLTGIEDFIDLESLQVSYHPITSLDLSTLRELRKLEVTNSSSIIKLDLSNNINLEYLDISDTAISVLDLTSNPKLVEFKARGGSLNEIDLSQNTALERINISKVPLSKIDLTNIPLLEELRITFTNIAEINVSNNTRLNYVYLLRNSLAGIDVSNNVLLNTLFLAGNHITTIDLSHNTILEKLYLWDNKLTEIDVSNNTHLSYLNLSENQLSNLDVSKNSQLETLDTGSNPDLSCIQVADVENALSQTDWKIDDTTSYSTDCSGTQDTDGDGITNGNDLCPNTPTGEQANASGCSPSQLANLAVQNISIGMGSDPCSDTPNCYVNIGVLQDVEINVTIIKNNADEVFDGPVNMANPLFLENLTEGEYRICASNENIPGFEQCYTVSSSATENSVNSTIVMQNAGQEYTLAVAGSKRYEVQVNDNTYTYDVASYEAKQITFPLEAGINVITVTGILDCSEQDRLTYVPDDNFEQALIDLGYDDVLDDYVATANLEEVTELSFYLLNITDLTGIEAMINLKNLAIEEDEYSPNEMFLNLSKNVNLETLVLVLNGLKTINLQNNIKLKELAILDNAITEIDLSKNKELTELTFVGTEMEALDVSGLAELVELTVLDNQLKALYVSELTELVELRVSGELEALDVSELTKLVKFNAQGCPNLYCIQVSEQQDTNSWVKDDIAVFSTDCTQQEGLTYVPDDNFEQALIDLGYDDVLDDYVVTANVENITDLDVGQMNISDLTGISGFTKLASLKCGANNLTNLNITELANLKILFCGAQPLEALDVSNNLELEILNIALTNIPEIDLLKNVKLKSFFVDSPSFKAIDLTANVVLEELFIVLSTITEIDLVQNVQLRSLFIESTEISSLDISNNTLLEDFSSISNPNLTCIQVWDEDFANSQPNWTKDNHTQYSQDCSSLDPDGISENEIEPTGKIISYPTLTTGKITIDNPNQEKIATISVAGMNGKRITLLPVHDNPREVHLDISGNSKGMYVIRVAKMGGKDEYIKVILD